MSETLDPLSEYPRQVASASESVLLVMHHVDLSMVGLVHRMASGPVTLGRDEPYFQSPSGASPLADPCISRQQARITPLGEQGFEVVPVAGARRAARCQTLDGRELPLPGVVPPGSLLRIGDRTLIGLLYRPASRLAGSLGLVGEGAGLVSLRNRIYEVAGGDETVLLTGETGAGKEMVARAIHDASAQRGGPFVAINCAALPENLAESELFGHVRGAFSGAPGGKGLFGAAEGGTLLLDEVGELSLSVQAKLLRALDTKRVRPVGGGDERQVRVRLLAATHRPLLTLSERGEFRFDLLSRLDGVQVHVPPLRERLEDVPLLFAHLLRERLNLDAAAWPESRSLLASLTRPAHQGSGALPLSLVLALLKHGWPGNVRELARLAQSLAVTARASGALPASQSFELAAAKAPPPTPLQPLARPLPAQSTERPRPSSSELAELLDRVGHVQSRAAAALGVAPSTFDRWMRELGVVRPRDLSSEQIARAEQEHGGDLQAMAEALHVSPRGLRQRIRELGGG